MWYFLNSAKLPKLVVYFIVDTIDLEGPPEALSYFDLLQVKQQFYDFEVIYVPTNYNRRSK